MLWGLYCYTFIPHPRPLKGKGEINFSYNIKIMVFFAIEKSVNNAE